MRVPLHINEEIGVARAGEIVTGGVPLPVGSLRDAGAVQILDPDGVAVPCVSEAYETWPDGSVRWLRVEFPVTIGRQEQGTWILEDTGDLHGRPVVEVPVEVEQDGAGITMRCRDLVVDVRPGPFAPLRCPAIPSDGRDSQALLLTVADGTGRRHRLREVRSVELVRSSPLGATVRCLGVHEADDAGRFLDAEVELTLQAGGSDLVIDHRIINREDTESVEVTAWEAEIEVGATEFGSCGVFDAVHRSASGFSLSKRGEGYFKGGFATSVVEGGDSWTEISPPEYRESWEWIELEGRHGSNWVHAGDGHGGIVVAVPQFVENHPSRLTYGKDRISIGFWPADEPEPLLLAQGMARRQRFVLRPTAGPPTTERMVGARVNTPLVFHTGSWALETGVLPPILGFDPARRPRLESLARAELLGWYLYGQSTGLMDYGDCVTPDPAGVRTGFSANNEEDAIWALLLHWLRGGERAVLDAATAYAHHTIDVDQVHHSSRNGFEHGGVRAHGRGHMKYAIARTADGEVESSIDTGHMWVEGLLLQAAVSGDDRYRDAAIAVGECFLRLIEIGWTLPQPGPRNSGWPLIALTALYRSTGEKRWLDGARTVVGGAVRAQNADGRWTMRVGFHESYCAWQNAVLLIGLDRLLEVDPKSDPKVVDAHHRGSRALIDLGRHADGAFIYLDRFDYRWLAWHGLVHEALAAAYWRSGDATFVEAGLQGGAAWLAHPGIANGRTTLSNDIAQWRGHLTFFAAAEHAGLMGDPGLDHVS